MCKEKPLNYSGVVQNFSSVVLECLDEQILDNLLRKFFVAQEAEDYSSGLPLKHQNQSKKFSKPTSTIFASRYFTYMYNMKAKQFMHSSASEFSFFPLELHLYMYNHTVS